MRRIVSLASIILTLLLLAIPVSAQTDTAEYAEVLRRIAVKIEALGRMYPHLAKFSIEKNVSGLRGGSEQLGIKYSNGVRQVPNPKYREGKKGPKSIPVYARSDGIELILNLMTEEETHVTRVVVPEVTIGNRVVELIVEGKNTRAIKEIRGKIRNIIKDEKAYYESKHAKIGQVFEETSLPTAHLAAQESRNEESQLLLVFKAYPAHEKNERNFYELAREIEAFVDSPRFPPTGVVTDKSIRYGVFAVKRARVLQTTDSRRSPRSPKEGVYVLALDPIYTVCARSYSVHAAKAGKRKITYTDCESGEGYEIPIDRRPPIAVYEIEVLTGNIFRDLWQERVGESDPNKGMRRLYEQLKPSIDGGVRGDLSPERKEAVLHRLKELEGTLECEINSEQSTHVPSEDRLREMRYLLDEIRKDSTKLRGSQSDGVRNLCWTNVGYEIESGRHTLFCPPNPTKAPVSFDERVPKVYGTKTYHNHSLICPAAVHAGVITFESGGVVTLEFRPGRESDTYTGSTRNGVTSKPRNAELTRRLLKRWKERYSSKEFSEAQASLLRSFVFIRSP